jgi:thermitase
MHSRAIRHSLLVVVLLFVHVAAHAQRVLGPSRLAPPYVPGQVVVGFHPGDRQAAADFAAAAGIRPVRSLPRINAQVYQLPGDRDVPSAVDDLASRPGVRYVEPNYRRRVLALSAPNDPAYNTVDYNIAPFDYDTDGEATWFQWTLRQIDALQAWRIYPNVYYTQATKPTNAPRIAVIDTGIDWGGTDGIPHADFINSGGSSPDSALGGQVDVALGRNLISGAPDPTDFADDYGHGTAVASAAAAATHNGTTLGSGIAAIGYHARILPIKTFDNTGNGTEADTAASIVYAADQGALIINISAGDIYYSQAEQDAVDYAWSKGSLVIAAAGNEGDSNNRPMYPAACDGVVGVAATTWPDDYPASYSNSGYYLMVGAPAGDVSLVPLGFWGTWCAMPTEFVPLYDAGWDPDLRNYQYHFGTSLAAPVVAGLASLYAAHKGITQATPNGPLTIMRALCRGCDDPLGTAGWNPNLGWGRVNAWHTLLEDDHRGSTVGGIRGQVLYRDTVVSNAVVKAYPPGGGAAVATATSKPDGMYQLANLAPGSYDLQGTYFGETQTLSGVPVEANSDTPRVRFNIGAQPTLTWVGTGGHAADGVDPETGNPGSTTFTFKVKYRDPSGNPPLKARCLIQQKPCGKTWTTLYNLAMSLESGAISTGAVFVASKTLPNETLRYKFIFQTAAGAVLTGAPAAYVSGPAIAGAPHLCWTGTTGFTTDGVEPNSGSTGTVFSFQVRYVDSAGDVPSTYELHIRRNGVLYKQLATGRWATGDYRTGWTYGKKVTLTEGGTYQYRFRFKAGGDWADGAPAAWQSGPAIEGAARVVVTGVTALPTRAGAEVVLQLSGAATLRVDVLNVAGRPIRSLAADRATAAGPQTLVWDGRSDDGLPAPAGLYLIRVTAFGDDGGRSEAVATVAMR